MAMEPEKAPTKKRTVVKKGIGGDPFEFCDVCNLNYDHGRRHRYLPSHLRALSSLLSRFQSKLSDLRFFLKNPVPLRPEHSALNRIWCVFCRLDLLELDSPFACGNAIEHMASEEHLKNVKDFLWKHGGGMDRADSFRVSESDLSKWKKDCELLKCAPSASGKGPIGPMPGPSKAIKNIGNVFPKLVELPLLMQLLCLLVLLIFVFWEVSDMFVLNEAYNPGNQVPYVSINRNALAAHSLPSEEDRRKFSRDNSNNDTHKPLCPNSNQANVHTGGAPPWLLSSGEKDLNLANRRCLLDSVSNTATQNGRSKKLNPKRVGAAWAEKRRLELELEEQGERIQEPHDDNWLPNFGRVWQAGTRKESRKEFEKEKRELSEKDQQSDTSFIVQPYLSKRMRTGSSNDGADAGSH